MKTPYDRELALSHLVDESRNRFMCRCKQCGDAYIGGRSSTLCATCSDDWTYEPNREALAMEARAEPEGRWGDE